MSEVSTKQQPTTIKGWLQHDSIRQQVAAALPKHMRPERMLRVATTALTRTPKLADCTQESFSRCLLELSALGLEPDGRRAHLIPYGKECTLIVDYKGLAELAFRSGEVASIHADVFCEGEHFIEDRGLVLAHQIDRSKPRGKVLGAYCIVRFKSGAEKHEVMGRDEIEAIRKRSRSANNGPWVTDWNEQAKKTVFRRLSKWLPLSPEVRDAIDRDSEAEEAASRRVVAQAPKTIDALSARLVASQASYDSLDQVREAIRTAESRDAVIGIARGAIDQHPEWEQEVDELATAAIEGMSGE